MRAARVSVSGSVSVDPRLPSLSGAARQARGLRAVALPALRLAGRVPPWAWLLMAGLAAAPWYLAYLAWVLTRWGGVETFMPRTP